MKSIIFGFIFGIILPIIGIIVGLQASSLLGNILLFPISVVMNAFDQPFGYLSGATRLGLFVFSGAFWALVFWLIAKARK